MAQTLVSPSALCLLFAAAHACSPSARTSGPPEPAQNTSAPTPVSTPEGPNVPLSPGSVPLTTTPAPSTTENVTTPTPPAIETTTGSTSESAPPAPPNATPSTTASSPSVESVETSPTSQMSEYSDSQGSTGPTPSPASAGCETQGVLFCDDFENAAVGATPGAPWSLAVNGTDGTVLVDGSTPAHSGRHSLRVSSGGNYQTFLTLRGAPVFPAPSPALFVRLYLRLDAAMTAGHNTYFKAGAADAITSNNETRVGVMMEMLMINQPEGDRGFLSNESYWTDQQLGVVVKQDEWTCIESFFDPPHSTVDFWVNGEEVPDLHRTDWKQDVLGSLHFGFEKYAGPDATVWYDDIVVSTEPIGCD